MMPVTSLLAQLLLVASLQSNSQVYLPIDCDGIYRHDNRSSSGVYRIYPGRTTTPLCVYCDMELMGGDGRLSNHSSMKFTTFDKDQDKWVNNCAQHFLGGFWYNDCHYANPTGMYAPHGAIAFNNVHVTWHRWKGTNYSLKTVAMKIRSVTKYSWTH